MYSALGKKELDAIMVDFSWNNLKRWTVGLGRSVNYHTHGRLFTPMPKYVCFRVTRNCNSRCVMCSDWKNKHHGEITVEEVRQVFSNPLLNNLKWINVLGGEPTIRRDIPDIIQSIYENVNLRGLGLNTNAFATEMIAQRIGRILEMSKANPKTRERHLSVVISVDGVGELHDRIRGIPGGFEKICNTLERLKTLRASDPRLSIGLSCCIQPQNVHGLFELKAFATERRVSINFFTMRFAHVFGNLHDRNNLLFRFSPSQVTVFKDFISSTDAYRSNDAFRWAWNEHFTVDSGMKRTFPCLWFYCGFMIFPDGNITLCDSNPEQVIGNLRERSIDAILGSRVVTGVRDTLDKSACRTCSFTTSEPAFNLEQEFWYQTKRRLAQRFRLHRGKRELPSQDTIQPVRKHPS